MARRLVELGLVELGLVGSWGYGRRPGLEQKQEQMAVVRPWQASVV